ncbi:WecB/TagA/CpsF family glycosyltransferase [Candidatus Woesebacteria bacterium]|nr:WecB/TagA/CpsF family glycosyltransferase [Candidatus Woesebacteria bacterium]
MLKRLIRKTMSTHEKTLLGLSLPTLSKKDIRENILKDAEKREGWEMVMSINPEIIEIAHQNPEFKNIILSSKYILIDGAGIVLASQLLSMLKPTRYTGVDFLTDSIHDAYVRRLTVMLIGGKGNVAERLADCYREKYSNLNVIGIEGYRDISRPTDKETQAIFSIVASAKPHLVFVAFGSPTQELWLYKNRAHLGHSVCAGVGGAFDFLAGDVRRAPAVVRKLGVEWAYRLVLQPWRWKRQVRLISFVKRVLKERLA